MILCKVANRERQRALHNHLDGGNKERHVAKICSVILICVVTTEERCSFTR